MFKENKYFMDVIFNFTYFPFKYGLSVLLFLSLVGFKTETELIASDPILLNPKPNRRFRLRFRF